MANQFELIQDTDSRWLLTGELTRLTIIGKQQKHFAKFAKNSQQVLDLSKISKIDTAGLAWLLSLLEYALAQQIILTYSQAPEELVKLAKLSQVHDILPLVND
ncbi:lipid asymmetry maintenance protein MlaB [Colwelliaceae bacterium BS250]